MGRPDLPLPLFEKVFQMLIKMADKSETSSGNIIKDTQTFATFQLGIHINWWHVTVCYLVGGYLISEVQEIYDNQAMWYQEWLFDITTIWLLSKVGNISRAHVLLEGLKSRTCNMSKKIQKLMGKAIQVIGASDLQLDVFDEIWYKLLLLPNTLFFSSQVL
ncbi:Tetratricopeptide repeat (TPR)-like superfamily protein [Raphanus sativus]|nr:Tetratricopeptide repeat (TPR)-like superfamily protein [Raphanus sativus]